MLRYSLHSRSDIDLVTEKRDRGRSAKVGRVNGSAEEKEGRKTKENLAR